MTGVRIVLISCLAALLVLSLPKVGDAQEEGAAAPPATNLFYEFRPVMVPVIRENRILGQLGVSFLVAVSDQATLDEVTLKNPHIREAIMQNLARLAKARINPRRPVDLEMVSRFMQSAVDSIIGAGRSQVLLQTASVTPKN